MLMTVHALTGALIGQKIANPIGAFFIALISHYLLDLIPHGDELIGQWIQRRQKKGFIVLIVDFSLTLLFILFILLKAGPLQLAMILPGIIGSILPDVFAGVIGPPGSYLLSHYKTYQKFTAQKSLMRSLLVRVNIIHEVIHNPFNKSQNPRNGLIFQSALSLLFLLLFLKTL
jgi:hypothetical protein